ncbi:amidohydrolase [Variovorax dokdonensis]|uniref:Amidohydrolase n=1 Tax=Variovorax dokdonensis TaxID=344883 RepID=A0ABT7NCF9_9BURK|nr:amidohydrolase [Variovorax dokdonensis]MDM0045629.1 amidohydrolase [Variovorax dokdonensis]
MTVTLTADSVWFNADVLTLDPGQPRASAIAIHGGRIVAVGSDQDILNLANAQTRRHDLHGRFVMPGLFDTHAHPLLGGLRDLFEASVGQNASIQKMLDAVIERAAKTKAERWITGGAWHLGQLEATGVEPRLLLDACTSIHPVALTDATYHHMWLNSAALAVCGIDASTPDPAGGRIVRDAVSGEPTGLLLEAATAIVRDVVRPDADQLREAVRYVRDSFHRLGLVGFKDALVDEPYLRAYHEADVAGALDLHAAMHLGRRSTLELGVKSFDELERLRVQYQSPHLHNSFIKLFLDGVAPSRTAAFLQPYLPCDDCSAQNFDPDAQLLIDPETLAQEVIEFDRRGFVVKMHAVGDRAVRAGLDAIEAARHANGFSGLRHEIGHTAFIDPVDMGRFAALGAVAEMSPRLWFPNPVTAGQYAVLGPARTNRCHQIKSLLDAGAELSYGSDWPAAAADANPWIGLAGMLTRRNPFGLFEGAVGADQAISLEQALPLFTTSAARTLGLEAVTGAIAPGKSADLVVLDRSLQGQTARDIAQTQPTMTLFEGRVVFER